MTSVMHDDTLGVVEVPCRAPCRVSSLAQLNPYCSEGEFGFARVNVTLGSAFDTKPPSLGVVVR